MDPQQTRQGRQHILFDADRISTPDAELFEPDALARSGRIAGRPGGGRGSACFLQVGGIPAVLRPYRRGGLLGPLLGDCYARGRLHASRPWREWWLLAQLHEEGFPVPAPLAARVRPAGPCYRAEILIERLPADTLTEVLRRGPLPAERWYAIGACIGRLHRRGLDHADLNAHNILLTADGTIHVIDLDRACLRPHGGHWTRRNLARLQRSLTKIARSDDAVEPVPENHLAALRQGWHKALEESA
ncbi:3-deoxy-D-manno-octulosonic acid kinase [Halorhodospira halophila]|uniref:3-deoxy-D-manno-octulosonic acid kinase n=1 Tax=Halorhodospira halophila (strain DSM 244 / SL1) TaxID=349124 RepID=A1WZB1_HALHL|nr:3-deoxy-D-manno-octulosonic acid kinase [Halorhodospira halophila]ABM63023.1 lipopolysaccharide kinase [Halorhodospira halophila SL1]MBK1727856.1 3-deoxy-D-manno-octulosonic acid kinase [Halorhodospira halophila]